MLRTKLQIFREVIPLGSIRVRKDIFFCRDMIPRATPKLRAPLRLFLVQESVFRQLLSRLSGEKRVAILSKNTSATALAPRVHSSMARRLRVEAPASSSLTPTSSTKRTATAQAIESTSKPRAPFRVVLVQASVPRRPLRVRNPNQEFGEPPQARVARAGWRFFP